MSLLLLLSSALLCSHLDSADASGPPALLSLLHNPLTEHLLQLLHKREQAPGRSPPTGNTSTEEDEEATERLLSRRDGPPLSIDLTFHLLRNMIHMAKAESQREQALLNRKLLDEVGK